MTKFNLDSFIIKWSEKAKNALYYGWAPLLIVLAARSAMKPLSQQEMAMMQKMMG